MNQAKLVIAIYRPKEGKLQQLELLVKSHFSTLKEHGFTTERSPFIVRSIDGSILEIFEWASEEASQKASAHPAVAKIWEAMALVCHFENLGSLPEAQKPFPHFSLAW